MGFIGFRFICFFQAVRAECLGIKVWVWVWVLGLRFEVGISSGFLGG